MASGSDVYTITYLSSIHRAERERERSVQNAFTPHTHTISKPSQHTHIHTERERHTLDRQAKQTTLSRSIYRRNGCGIGIISDWSSHEIRNLLTLLQFCCVCFFFLLFPSSYFLCTCGCIVSHPTESLLSLSSYWSTTFPILPPL